MGIDLFGHFEIGSASNGRYKMFIELAFHEWVIFEKRYDFTVMVNKRLSRFSIPYRLQNGRLIQEGYKTSYYLDKILNYSMFERKIRYSEEMITSREYLDKKKCIGLHNRCFAILFCRYKIVKK